MKTIKISYKCKSGAHINKAFRSTEDACNEMQRLFKRRTEARAVIDHGLTVPPEQRIEEVGACWKMPDSGCHLGFRWNWYFDEEALS